MLCSDSDHLVFAFLLLQTDPALIGGMVVEIGDKYIDMSTATKIKRIVQHISVEV